MGVGIMKFVRMGSTGVQVSRLCLGCMSFGKTMGGMGTERGREQADHQESGGRRHRLFRHRGHLRSWRKRNDSWKCVEEFEFKTRRARGRDQGVRADGSGAES